MNNKYCPNCGATLAEGAKFCEDCGAAVIRSSGEKHDDLITPHVDQLVTPTPTKSKKPLIIAGAILLVAVVIFAVLGNQPPADPQPAPVDPASFEEPTASVDSTNINPSGTSDVETSNSENEAGQTTLSNDENIIFNADGSRIEREFDSEGKIISGEYYDMSGKLVLRAHLEYDDNGNEMSRTAYYWDENGDYILNESGERQKAMWIDFERDANGNLLKYAIYSDSTGSGDITTIGWTNYSIAANGNRIKAAVFDSDGQLRREELYDDKGNKTEQITYRTDGAIQWRWTYTYDSSGNLLKTTRNSTLTDKFPDAKDINPSYRDAVDIITSLDLIDDYWDGGSFSPDISLTRMELVDIIVNLDLNTYEKVKLIETGSFFSSFSDVDPYDFGVSIDTLYTNYAVDKGYMSGYGDGRFGPDDPVTSIQFLTVMLRLLGYEEGNDPAEDAYWGTYWENIAQEIELTNGIENIDLQNNISREEAAQIIMNAIINQQIVEYIGGEYVETGVTLIEDRLNRNTDLTPRSNGGEGTLPNMLMAIKEIE